MKFYDVSILGYMVGGGSFVKSPDASLEELVQTQNWLYPTALFDNDTKLDNVTAMVLLVYTDGMVSIVPLWDEEDMEEAEEFVSIGAARTDYEKKIEDAICDELMKKDGERSQKLDFVMNELRKVTQDEAEEEYAERIAATMRYIRDVLEDC